MNNITQIFKKVFLTSIFLLAFLSVNAQNAIVGSGFSTGWGGGGCPTGNTDFKYLASNAGGSYGLTTTANGTGDQLFRFGVDWDTTTAQLAITPGSDVDVAPNTTYTLNPACTTSGAMKYSVPNISYNYVFKTLNAGTNPTGSFVFFEVQGAVRSVSTVTQSPLAANVTLCSSTTVTATLDGALSAGQAVYMRYTKDGYATSTIVPLTGSGVTYTGTIPSTFNSYGATVSYYVFTSGTATPSAADADLYTINLNNNSGPNYSYTVGGATTAIPDVNFEQALIDLNLDCVIDGKVLTSNISGVDFLNLTGKNIASLEGINDFINLNYLYCGDNALTSLDISGLTNLWELVASNNNISSLDVSSSSDLYYLVCDHNSLTNLNISGLTRLTVLDVLFNQLSNTLDVSNNPDLYYFDCENNQLTVLNISGLTKLKELYTSNNPFIDTTLDVHLNPDLNSLICKNNGLTNLNISGLTKLEVLDTSNNPFIDTTLDVHLNPNLNSLVCQNNGLTNLNISGLTKLVTLDVYINQLTSSLDVSNNPNLKYLDCDDNDFTSINVTGLAKLETFYCSGNQLASISVTGTTNLDIFYCYSNTPAGIDIFVDNVQAANAISTNLWKKDPASVYTYCQSGSNTTWDGLSWSPAAPTSGTAAIISGNYSEAANIDACTLTIKNNAIVTIPSGYKVTLNAPITVEAGSSFTLSNDANLIQTNKLSVNSGDITVKRNSNALKRLDYTLWSSPVSGAQTLSNFSPLTSQSPSRFYSFDTSYSTGGVNGAYSTIASPTTATFSKGAGYMIRMPNTDPTSGYDAGTATLAYPGAFTGLPNNGDVPVVLSYADAQRSYNLVGNPYPTVIDADTFIVANTTNIENTLYFWRKINGASGSAYATYTAGVGGTATSSSDIPNGKIQVGQGFFVQAKSPATVPAFFTNAMRDAGLTSTQFFKTKKVAEKDRIWLNLTNAKGVFSQALVAYLPEATSGVDRYDGKYINDSKIALTSNINNEEYTIQSRPAFDASDVVALNFKTDVAGDYAIAIDHADGLFANGQDVYLVDSKTGAETNLKTSSYTFTAVSGVDNTRFSLKYQKTLKVDAPVFNGNSVTVYKNNGVVYVNSRESAIKNIKVYDVQGRLIAEQKDVKASTATINNLKAIHQVLIVKVTTEDNKVISKKVAN